MHGLWRHSERLGPRPWNEVIGPLTTRELGALNGSGGALNGSGGAWALSGGHGVWVGRGHLACGKAAQRIWTGTSSPESAPCGSPTASVGILRRDCSCKAPCALVLACSCKPCSCSPAAPKRRCTPLSNTVSLHLVSLVPRGAPTLVGQVPATHLQRLCGWTGGPV